MPGIGDGRRSSSLEPAGKSLSKAMRGSAGGCSAVAAVAAVGAVTAVARGAACPGCAAQRIKAKTARYRDMQGAPKLIVSTSVNRGGSLDSSRALRSRFLPSAARMVLGVQVLQAFARHVRIYLRRGQIAMAEEHLHHAQIRAVIQQMRRKGVAQSMR